MAVYVAPDGLLGRAYMTFIRPFRYLIVYPSLERALARRWDERHRPGARVSPLLPTWQDLGEP